MRAASARSASTPARLAHLLTVFALLLAASYSLTTFASPSPSPAPAQAQRQPVVATLTGEVERDGKSISAEDVRVQPGEIITYRVAVSNVSSTPKSNLHIDGPVPQGTQFVGNSVDAGGARVLYSIDGGRTFSERPTVKKVVGGVERDVPAPASDFTTVRFVWDGSLSPGQVRNASYRTRVR